MHGRGGGHDATASGPAARPAPARRRVGHGGDASPICSASRRAASASYVDRVERARRRMATPSSPARSGTAPARRTVAALRTRQTGCRRRRAIACTASFAPCSMLDDGIDVFETARCSACQRGDARSRSRAGARASRGTELTPRARREIVRLRGTETAQRRLLSRLAHDEMDAASFHPETFRRALSGARSSARTPSRRSSTTSCASSAPLGYYVNELAISDVLLHIAIAADRVAADACPRVQRTRGARRDPRWRRDRSAGSRRSLRRRSRTRATAATSPRSCSTRIVAPGEDAAGDVARAASTPTSRPPCAPRSAAAAEDYQVDLVDETSCSASRCTCRTCVRRAEERAWSRNPLTRSLKTSLSDDLRGRRLHRERAARPARHADPRRRDRLHRDARRAAASSAAAGRIDPHRDDRLPRLLRAARAAAIERRPFARAGDRGHERRHQRRPRLGVVRHRPGAQHDRATGASAIASCASSRSSPTPTSNASQAAAGACDGDGGSPRLRGELARYFDAGCLRPRARPDEGGGGDHPAPRRPADRPPG